jgi:hypothetical protein
VMKLADKLETMTSGKTCLIAWDADADEVWEVSERMAEKIEAKMAAKRKRWGGEKGGCGTCGKSGCGDCEKGGCEEGECPMQKKAEAEEETEEKEGRRPFRDDEF